MLRYLEVPWIFRGVAWVQNTRRRTNAWVTPTTDLLIEGYPRSANTFLVRIVRAAVRENISIAHHVHLPQQITFAMQYGVPSFILLRDPLHAIASRMVRRPEFRASFCIDQYIRFFEAISRYAQHDGLHVIDFEDVTKDPVRVARAMLDLVGVEHFVDQDTVARAKEDQNPNLARRSFPNPHKERLKQEQYAAIQNAPEFEHATELYRTLRDYAWRL